MIVFASVLLPEPFGPINAWISPLRTVRLRPLRISLPSTDAWRFSITSSGVSLMSGSSLSRLRGVVSGGVPARRFGRAHVPHVGFGACQTEKLSPHAQLCRTFGLLNL